MESFRVVPMHPAEGREFKIINRFPRPRFRGPSHELGLVVAVHGLSKGVIVAVANSSDRGRRPDLGEAFPITNGRELTARIAVTTQVWKMPAA